MKFMKRRAQAGFTLVELIVVIVILGILAAVAVPRFMGLETEARVAAVKSLGGTLKSAANMAHAVCQSQACAPGATLTIEGQSITFVNGYPNNATIGLLVQSLEGFTPVAGTPNRFTKNGSNTANCWVQYVQAANATTPPTIRYQAGTIVDATTETTVNTALRKQC
jgi:MSHA pilin protein MshA